MATLIVTMVCNVQPLHDSTTLLFAWRSVAERNIYTTFCCNLNVPKVLPRACPIHFLLFLCQHTPLYLEKLARVSTSTQTEHNANFIQRLMTTVGVIDVADDFGCGGGCVTVDNKSLACVADGLAVATEPLTGATPPKTSPERSQGVVQQIPGKWSKKAMICTTSWNINEIVQTRL